LSADRLLNVFIEQTAPNQTSYKVEITGKVTIGGEKRKIKYETLAQQAKFGKVRFIIDKDIQTILEPMASFFIYAFVAAIMILYEIIKKG
jgi:hypothetical protein